jgi:hypothetical protein
VDPMTRGPSGPASRRVLEGMVPTKDHSIADSRPDKRNDQRRTEAHPASARTRRAAAVVPSRMRIMGLCSTRTRLMRCSKAGTPIARRVKKELREMRGHPRP